MTKVSVIIPVYNTEKYLPKCLDSIINQSLDDIEIICINDCSTDRSLEILKYYVQKDKRIKLINLPQNKGVGYARNIGIDNANGEYIGFVDSDDFIDLNFLEKLYIKAKETKADAAKGNIYNYDINSGKSELTDFYKMNEKIRKNKAYFYYGFTSAIYKKKFLDKYKIRFPEGIKYFEDPYFSIKACIKYSKVTFDNSAKYYYSQYKHNSASTHATLENFKDFKTIGLKIFDLLNETNVSPKSYHIIASFLFNFVISNYHNANINENIRESLFDIIIEFLFISKYNQTIPNIIYRKFTEEVCKYKYYDLILKYYKNDYLNKNQNIVKILISYIKPSFLFKTDILTPIHLGRSVEKEISKDGIANDNDIKWLHKNCVGDDDFDGNISYLNRRVGFFTGTFWAWKNYEKLGNPEYFGSMGYRRLLFPCCLNNIENYDLIIPKKKFFIETLKLQMIKCHGKLFYDIMIDTIEHVYPNDADNVKFYFNRHSGYFAEMYIMKKEIFFEFCNWMLKILNYLVKKYPNAISVPQEESCGVETLLKNFIGHDLDLSDKETDIRDFAFIIERLTGYFLYKLTCNKIYKYNEVYIFEPDYISSICEKENYKALVLNKMRQNVLSSLKRGNTTER